MGKTKQGHLKQHGKVEHDKDLLGLMLMIWVDFLILFVLVDPMDRCLMMFMMLLLMVMMMMLMMVMMARVTLMGERLCWASILN